MIPGFFRTFLRVVALGTVFTIGRTEAAPPEYLANEQVAPDAASALMAPFDGFVSERLPVDPADRMLGPGLGTYLPVIQPLMDDAVFELAPRSYYRHFSVNGEIPRQEWAAGGGARMITGWWRDSLRLGISGFTSQPVAAPDEGEGTGLLGAGGQGYWALGEAYLEARVGERTIVKGGRQELDLPFFNRNDSRMTPQSHEAIIATHDLWPNLRMGAGHVTRMKERNAEEFRSLSELAGAGESNRGATLAGMRFSLADDKGSIGVLNGSGWDTFNTFYAESTRLWDLPGDFELNTSSQFIRQDSIGQALSGEFDTHALGGQAALSFRSMVGSVAYTATGRDEAIRHPWGGSPSFNSVMISDFDRAGEKAWRAGLSYRFDRLGLPGISAFANYVHGNTPESGPAGSPDQEEINVTVDLKPESGVFRNFWLRIRHGWNDRADGNRREDFRIILNYSKEF